MSALAKVRGLGPGGMPLLIWGLGLGELLLIVGLIILIFGARKIPLMARGLGEGIRNFKGEIGSGSDDDEPRRREDGDGPSS